MELDERDPFEREAERFDERGIDAASARASDYWHGECPDYRSIRSQDVPQGHILSSPEDERIWLDREGERLRRPTFEAPALLERRELLSMLAATPGFHEHSWAIGSLEYRLNLFDKAEAALSYLHGRSPASIEFFSHVQRQGYFRAQPLTIGVNRVLASGDDPKCALKVYLHEARHAYQRHVIGFPYEHPEVSMDLFVGWREARRTHRRLPEDPTPEEYMEYYNHPLEVDAREYAQRQTSAFYATSRRTG